MINDRSLNILIFGPSGAGKGTQAKKIAQEFSLVHLQSGEILRKIANNDSEFGRSVKAALQEGFVPYEWILDIIKDTFKDIDTDQGIIIDGFSRKVPEIKFLLNSLEELGRKIDFVFILDISDEEAVCRLLKRKICPVCKKIYSSDLEKCLNCDEVLISREDDKRDAILKRLEDYKKETLPVINFLKEKDYKIFNINGEQVAEKVFEDIYKIINK